MEKNNQAQDSNQNSQLALETFEQTQQTKNEVHQLTSDFQSKNSQEAVSIFDDFIISFMSNFK